MGQYFLNGSGSNDPKLLVEALQTLEQTSRTFFIPISQLPASLQQAVGSAYLCLRSIDEIEDHPTLEREIKVRLLRNISRTIQASGERLRIEDLLVSTREYQTRLEDVTVRLPEWLVLAPRSIAHRIWDATATMADRMADWASDNFLVACEADLDRYTMGVAGAVGLMLSDLWAWFDGTQTDRGLAIGFGRGLQAVNILRNRFEDMNRGVDFFPTGWDTAQMQRYAQDNLGLADAYLAGLPPGPAFEFCRIPLLLAHATLKAIEQGKVKLERGEVLRLLGMEASDRSGVTKGAV